MRPEINPNDGAVNSKVISSPSGSDPLSVIETEVSSSVVTEI